jgi:hypothetical protein
MQLLQTAFDRVVRVVSQRMLHDERLHSGLYGRVIALITAQLQRRSALPQGASGQTTASAAAAAAVSGSMCLADQRLATA